MRSKKPTFCATTPCDFSGSIHRYAARQRPEEAGSPGARQDRVPAPRLAEACLRSRLLPGASRSRGSARSWRTPSIIAIVSGKQVLPGGLRDRFRAGFWRTLRTADRIGGSRYSSGGSSINAARASRTCREAPVRPCSSNGINPAPETGNREARVLLILQKTPHRATPACMPLYVLSFFLWRRERQPEAHDCRDGSRVNIRAHRDDAVGPSRMDGRRVTGPLHR